MNDQPKVSQTPALSGPLGYGYPAYKDMYDNNVIFVYKGLVTSDLVTHVLEIMGERLEEERTSRKLSKKVFNVMVECLTNVYTADDPNAHRAKFDPAAVLLVKKDEDSYCVTTGHYIYNERVAELKFILDRINSMTHEELKSYYQEVLSAEDPAATGLTDLAIVDLSRKSKHKLLYTFKYITSDYSFFSLESRISKDSL
jgi:hypothetical protein